MEPKNQPPQPERERLVQRIKMFEQFVQECTACQAEAAPHWVYCASCGSRLATECPGCGAPLPPHGARFCPSCGISIPTDEVPSIR